MVIICCNMVIPWWFLIHNNLIRQYAHYHQTCIRYVYMLTYTQTWQKSSLIPFELLTRFLFIRHIRFMMAYHPDVQVSQQTVNVYKTEAHTRWVAPLPMCSDLGTWHRQDVSWYYSPIRLHLSAGEFLTEMPELTQNQATVSNYLAEPEIVWDQNLLRGRHYSGGCMPNTYHTCM